MGLYLRRGCRGIAYGGGVLMWFELKKDSGDWLLIIGESENVGFSFYLNDEDLHYIQELLKEAGF
jgi:hypothetical protein